MENYTCVGLFGTCGNSTFRQDIMIPKFESEGIPYFNPQVPDWNPEFAKAEARHLANDAVICFPVTSETYGTGSLAETGFSIISAIQSNRNAKIIIYIADDVDQHLKDEDPVAAKESVRARALVKAHLEKLDAKNVYIVESIEDMTEVAALLFKAAKYEYKARFFIEVCKKARKDSEE